MDCAKHTLTPLPRPSKPLLPHSVFIIRLSLVVGIMGGRRRIPMRRLALYLFF